MHKNTLVIEIQRNIYDFTICPNLNLIIITTTRGRNNSIQSCGDAPRRQPGWDTWRSTYLSVVSRVNGAALGHPVGHQVLL